ncbi:hypothetical protein CDD82_7981 [Ophiocordyceps australis]|uniref:Amino acid transporter transmembrane domain-containing protein n=1 Tax=Ophiocordyceps australis TaxID=1399860 RepID=A0A2C5YQ21_9HYPO|nr:hypothetical protein CDD82_7981 [Ophiocordyceps australis]
MLSDQVGSESSGRDRRPKLAEDKGHVNQGAVGICNVARLRQMAPSAARRQSPSDSAEGSSVLMDEEALIDDEATESNEAGRAIVGHGRRRSSVTERLASMADVGGVNSFRSFARSWQRAAGFVEVIPRRPSLVLSSSPDQPERAADDEAPRPDQDAASAVHQRSSILSQQLRRSASWQHHADSSIFAVAPHLATPSVIESYGSFRSWHYGSTGERPSRCSFSHGSGWTALHGHDASVHDASGLDTAAPPDDHGALGQDHPLLVREVKQGDRVVLTVEGRSTLPQSVFNSINSIIGVGLLSLPLAFNMSGWLLGLLLMTMMAAVTAHTAKLLGRCMQLDASLVTYSDLAYLSFGSRARLVVSLLFTLELLAACLALVILFADSLHLLLPGLFGVNVWKCLCAALVLVLNALPLRWLSYTSVVGILSTFSIVCIVMMDGLIKPHAPGSLRQPAATSIMPSNWLSLPLAYGLMASPWGAHSVFPSIYRDMRHATKWSKGVNITFSFSYTLDTCLAVIGLLMFGDAIKDTVTSNILRTPGYPHGLNILMSICIAMIPLTKIPLNARPIITTLDVLCRLDHGQTRAAQASPSTYSIYIQRALVRIFIVALLLAISILFPAFDSVCAFLGAALCSLISIILPLLFYLRLFGRRISARESLACWLLVAVFSVFGAVGTVWTFLPKHLVGASA